MVSLRKPLAVVVGGSIGGLFTGLALRQQGWDVQIHESAQRLDGRGAGITTHKAVFEALDALGLENARSIGLQIETRTTIDISGKTLGTLRLPQLVTSWGRLHQLLLDAFPAQHYYNGSTYSNHEQHGLAQGQAVPASPGSEKGITVHFSEGHSQQADLLVAADGIRSSVRQQLDAQVQPVYAGYFAWRGLIEEAALDAAEHESLFSCFSFCLPPGEQLLAYPVAGDTNKIAAGNRRLNVVWYRPADRKTQLQDLLTDVEGQNNGSSIAPDRIRPAVVDDMRRASQRLLSPQHAALVGKIRQPFIQPIYDVMSNSMVKGCVAVVGDAAFTARPHLGMGVTKVAEDALCLARCLSCVDAVSRATVEQALRQYEQERLPTGQMIVDRSRQLGAYLQGTLTTEREIKSADLHRSFEAVMRETATDDFVREYLQAQSSSS